jgi:hypothetical protein
MLNITNLGKTHLKTWFAKGVHPRAYIHMVKILVKSCGTLRILTLIR